MLAFLAALGFVTSPLASCRSRAFHAQKPILDLGGAGFIAPHVAAPRLPWVRGGGAPKLPDVQRLLTDAFFWGLSRCANAEDVWLALVSPSTFRLLSEWKLAAFGDEAKLRRKLRLSSEFLHTRLDRPQITVRTKGLWSTFSKSAVRRQHVHDMLALRIVVEDERACFLALGEVQSAFPSLPGRAKNYVHLPKANGYQALHDTVLLPCGTPMEVQVRSQEMHWHAELGGASHRQYKGLHELPTRLLSSVVAPRLRPFGPRRE